MTDISKKLQKIGLGSKIQFIESRESNVTTAWGVDWNELFISRDILQNFYDANKEKVEEILIEVDNNRTVTVSAPSSFNIKRLFYIGSEKTSDDVGKYGEGFKAACVCLLRDYQISPIAISEDQIYYIHLSETPVDDTEMFPLIYDHYISDNKFNGTKLILENCTPKLIETFKEGLNNFFFTHNHPLIGEYLGDCNKNKIYFYKSKDKNGYVYFEKLLRAKLGDEVPFVFVFNHAYAKIKNKIGLDRDRKTFSKSDDLSVFYDEMWFDKYDTKKILIHTEEVLWSKGKGHAIFQRCATDNTYYKDIFQDNYFVKSTSDDVIENLKIKELEEQWKNEGKVCLPGYFERFGIISGKKIISELKTKAETERKNIAKRPPTINEKEGIELFRNIMNLFAPETANIFDKQRTEYIIIDTELLLGEFKNNRSYRSREVYLSGNLFISTFSQILTTFLHEHSHIYGYDGSRNFTDALTDLLEKFIEYRNLIDEYENKWNLIKEKIAKDREIELTDKYSVWNEIEKLNETEIKHFIRKIPTQILEMYIKNEKNDNIW